jgi:hypothetical protein
MIIFWRFSINVLNVLNLKEGCTSQQTHDSDSSRPLSSILPQGSLDLFDTSFYFFWFPTSYYSFSNFVSLKEGCTPPLVHHPHQVHHHQFFPKGHRISWTNIFIFLIFNSFRSISIFQKLSNNIFQISLT